MSDTKPHLLDCADDVAQQVDDLYRYDNPTPEQEGPWLAEIAAEHGITMEQLDAILDFHHGIQTELSAEQGAERRQMGIC